MIEWIFVSVICIGQSCDFIVSNQPIDREKCLQVKKQFLNLYMAVEEKINRYLQAAVQMAQAKTLTKGKHLKLKVSDPESKQWISANAWRKGHLADKIKENSLVDLAFTMSMDEWMGKKSLTLTVIDIKQRS